MSPVLEHVLTLGALLFASAAQAAVPTVVTFDNGEFNAPLYTPRWNGQWKQPSVAQEVATSIARVIGENPRVYTYLPPGQAPGRPGGAWHVLPIRPGCVGRASAPSDRCWCSPADNCWGSLGPSWYAQASTSLFLTASNLRSTLSEELPGPRVEIHITDLFEEDPSAAENPADSDRCITPEGVRKAVAGLLAPTEGEALDHVAVGLLRATVDPPPPGSSWGYTYGLVQSEDGRCWSGAKTGSWDASHEPLTLVMAVLILGVDTADQHVWVSALMDGLVGQLHAGRLEFGLVRLREPIGVHPVAEITRRADVEPWALAAPGPTSSLPCGSVTGSAALVSGARPVPVAEVVGRCDGSAEVRFRGGALAHAFAVQAGLDPRWSAIELTGGITLSGDGEAVRAAFDDLEGINDGDRPLPLLSAMRSALALDEAPSPTRVWRPWAQQIEISSLKVTDMDTRPWLVALVSAALSGMFVGALVAAGIQRMQARRALQAHWEASLGGGADALIQRPMAVVIGEAQEEVSRRWPLRLAVGTTAGLAVSVITLWLVMLLNRVFLG